MLVRSKGSSQTRAAPVLLSWRFRREAQLGKQHMLRTLTMNAVRAFVVKEAKFLIGTHSDGEKKPRIDY
jgi:hypothetical protein